MTIETRTAIAESQGWTDVHWSTGGIGWPVPDYTANETAAAIRSLASERDQLRAELATCKDASEALIESLRTERDEIAQNALDQMNARHAADTRAHCLQQEVDRWVKWREEQPWLAEIHSYQQQVKSLTDEVARLKARLYQGCDDERDMAISEGPAHGVCGLAEELTKRAEHAEAAINREMDQHNEAVAERIEQQSRAERLEAALETCREQLEIRERIGNAAEAELAKERARVTAAVAILLLLDRNETGSLASREQSFRAAIDAAMTGVAQ